MPGWLQYSLLTVAVAWASGPAAWAAEPAADAASSTEQVTLFFDRIQPLLTSKCQQCHGAEKQEGELRVDSREALLKGGATGPALKLGSPDESLLMVAVRHTNADLQMPPKEKLPDADLAALSDWIKQGASWPAQAAVLFEDEAEVAAQLNEGGGNIRLDEADKFRGTAALVVAPQRLAVKIAGWSFPIREQPAAGEYRFIRFAWKKRGPGAILFEVARNGTWREQPQTNGAWVAGKNSTGWGAVNVSDSAPNEWTTVTRDLWADGQWGDFQLTGMCLTAVEGGEALLDSVILGRDQASLAAYDLGRGQLALEKEDDQGPLGDAWHDPRNPIRKLFQGQRLDLWSLKKPVRPELPAVKNSNWVRKPIDQFILAKLESAGLTPSPEADRRTLIRRLYFDLIGLPPEPTAVATFVADEAPDAYEKLVEQLLANPHYGERWARHWLDVVRYSDTNNFERDEFRPQAWHFRDWVIRALNADLPYDQFLRMQLAGDELAPGTPNSQAEVDAHIATGFLRLGPWDSTATIFQEDNRARDQLLADLVNTTGSAVLGMTLACCNCHDHKYDPLSQADHFRMRAFFAGLKFRDDLPIDAPELRAEIDRHNAGLEKKIAPLQKAKEKLLAGARQRVQAERRSKFPAEITTLLKKPAHKRTPAEQEQAKPFEEQLAVNDKDAEAALNEKEKPRHEELNKQIAELTGQRRAYSKSFTASDEGPNPPATLVFFQGDHTQPKDEVPPGFLSVLDPNPAEITRPGEQPTSGRRTALVDWLVSEANPLTARVMVNRLWQHHFGVGLVASPNDFGYSGTLPTHPELLDWLAIEFREQGWSLKQMHRMLVLSAAYRQSSVERAEGSKLDLDNHLLWRQNVQRLNAETLRDALLHVSGRLLPVAEGAPKWPPVPEELLSAQPAILEAMEGKDSGRGQGYPAQPLEETFVRTIFLVQKACVPLPMLQAFDLPEVSVSCGRRNVTTVAPQALTLLNGDFAVAMSHAFAERLTREAGTDEQQQIALAIRLSLSRAPEAEETRLLTDMLARHRELHLAKLKAAGTASPDEAALATAAQQAALVDLCRALLNLNEFAYID